MSDLLYVLSLLAISIIGGLIGAYLIRAITRSSREHE